MPETMFQQGSVQSSRVIYTPSVFAKTSLLYLQEVGSLQAVREHTSRRKGLNSYLFFLIQKGSGHVTIDGETFAVQTGDCVFIDCKRSYAHTPAQDDLWTLQWIHFNGPSMGEIYAKYLDRGGRPVFSSTAFAQLSSILSGIQTLAASDVYIRDMKLNEKIASLLTIIMAESWHPGQSHSGAKKQSLHAIKSYLDTHYMEHVTLDYLADTFYINKFYLSRVFREQYGTTILTYLDQVRVSHAKQLLRFSGMSVEEIGVHVGINEPGYFNRVFKKVEGVTPGEYRKTW